MLNGGTSIFYSEIPAFFGTMLCHAAIYGTKKDALRHELRGVPLVGGWI